MNHSVTPSSISESTTDSTARMRLRRVRTLNEIAFLAGDRARGGPAREAELAALQTTLRQLDESIAAAESRQPKRHRSNQADSSHRFPSA